MWRAVGPPHCDETGDIHGVALTPSFSAFNHIARSSSEIQTPKSTPLIKDSEGLRSRLVSLHVIDALRNYLWTFNA